MTQREKIHAHLLQFNGITQHDATLCYGCTRLAPRIEELKKQLEPLGIHIDRKMIAVTNRVGEKVVVARYYIQKKTQP